MDIRKVKKLIELLEESNVDEIEISEGEESIRISRNSRFAAQQAPMQYASAPYAPAPAPVAAAAPVAEVKEPVVTGHQVKSPMVGTFYRSSSPGAAPFVQVGDTVKEGDTLCIIEAMKILNEIESDKAGVVKQVLCENGQAVEYGQTLYIIE